MLRCVWCQPWLLRCLVPVVMVVVQPLKLLKPLHSLGLAEVLCHLSHVMPALLVSELALELAPAQRMLVRRGRYCSCYCWCSLHEVERWPGEIRGPEQAGGRQ